MADQYPIARAVDSANDPDQAIAATEHGPYNPPQLKPELVGTLDTPDAIRELFTSGVFPYSTKISAEEYEDTKRQLQVELLKVQRWVKDTGQKIVLLFEGLYTNASRRWAVLLS